MNYFLLLITIFVFLSILLIIQFIAHLIIYQPSNKIIWRPPPSTQNYMVNGIHIWYQWQFPGKKIILYCHGNNGNISEREYIFELCKEYHLNLCIFDYSGYGWSCGRPSQKQLCKDGLSAYEFVSRRHHWKDIILWGESLGTSIATFIASKRKCKRLILLAPFTSLDDIVKDKAGKLVDGMCQLVFPLIDLFPTKEWIKNVKCPIAILHSKEDQLISFNIGKKLYDNVKGKKLFIPITGRHGGPNIEHQNIETLLDFCKIIPKSRCNGVLRTISLLELRKLYVT